MRGKGTLGIEKGLDFVWDSGFTSQSTDVNYPGDERRAR